MKMDVSETIHSLDSKEINVLLKLYYHEDLTINNSNKFENDIIKKLTDKNLISINIKSKENILDLTDFGQSVCKTVVFNRVAENSNQFHEEIKRLPERAVSCFVKRILWRNEGLKDNFFIRSAENHFLLNQNIWYERVLLTNERIGNTLENFYSILEKLNFIENNNGQRWCLPEVENFLKDEYRKIMDLTWIEEDSLKYYFFFYLYAKEQKNLIKFSGDGEKYRPMLYNEDISLKNNLFSLNESDLKTVLSFLGISKKRIIGFLEDMQYKEIVGERYYPLINSTFFRNEDNVFVINDIKGYMDYLKIQFLDPVVDSILRKTN